MSVKSKLLEACGDLDISDLGEAALVDILVGKIKSLEDKVRDTQAANAHERQLMEHERHVYQEQRKNPGFFMSGMFFLEGRFGALFKLEINGSQIRVMECTRKLIWMMQFISPEDFSIKLEQRADK